jgi:hypothetical protein
MAQGILIQHNAWKGSARTGRGVGRFERVCIVENPSTEDLHHRRGAGRLLTPRGGWSLPADFQRTKDR